MTNRVDIFEEPHHFLDPCLHSLLVSELCHRLVWSSGFLASLVGRYETEGIAGFLAMAAPYSGITKPTVQISLARQVLIVPLMRAVVWT